MKFSFQLLAFTLLLANSSAAPTGAGGCGGDGPAVGGPHLDENAITGSLEDFGLRISVNSDELESSGTISVPANSENMISLFAEAPEAGSEYRGFLFRLSHPDGVSTLDLLDIPESSADEAQVAAVCTDIDVAGITHVNNEPKTSMSVTMNVPEATDGLVLDVTAVIWNRLVNETFVSEYYYSQYQINVEASAEGTTMPTAGEDGEEGSPTLAPASGEEADGSGTGSLRDTGSLTLAMASLLSFVWFELI